MKQEKALTLVAELLAKVKSASQMKDLLVDLMTPAELQDVAERILICRALKTGTSQRTIAQSLGLSVTTINKGSRVMKYGTGEIPKII